MRMRQYMTDGQFREGAEERKLLRKHGMNGKQVIIGIGDTGIDEKSTFFFDRDHSIQYDKASLDLTHRKVVYYQNLGDHTDTKDRHARDACCRHGGGRGEQRRRNDQQRARATGV